MLRVLTTALVGAVLTTFAGSVFAQAQSGSAAEAKTMLEKAVSALKADKTKALPASTAPPVDFGIAIYTYFAPRRTTSSQPMSIQA